MEFSAPVGVLNARPPRLEDAGLEDCALPAHAIQEAFKRAADAVRNVSSAATGILGMKHDDEPDECAHNPGPTNGSWEDRCLGPSGIATLGEKESCVETKAGGLIEEGHDLVVQGGDDIKVGRLLVVSEAGPKLGEHGCVGARVDEDTPESKENEGGPILIGAVI